MSRPETDSYLREQRRQRYETADRIADLMAEERIAHREVLEELRNMHARALQKERARHEERMREIREAG